MEFNDYSSGSADPNEGVCCIPTTTTTTSTSTTTVRTCSNIDGLGTRYDCGWKDFNTASGNSPPSEAMCCETTTTTTTSTTSTTECPCAKDPSCRQNTTTTTSTTSTSTTTSVTTTAKNAWSAEFDATYADLGRLLTTNLECAEGCLGDQLSSLHQLRTELETQVDAARVTVAQHQYKEKQLENRIAELRAPVDRIKEQRAAVQHRIAELGQGGASAELAAALHEDHELKAKEEAAERGVEGLVAATNTLKTAEAATQREKDALEQAELKLGVLADTVRAVEAELREASSAVAASRQRQAALTAAAAVQKEVARVELLHAERAAAELAAEQAARALS